MADLGEARFHAVFEKNWQNCMLTPPGELAPPGKILDLPLMTNNLRNDHPN